MGRIGRAGRGRGRRGCAGEGGARARFESALAYPCAPPPVQFLPDMRVRFQEFHHSRALPKSVPKKPQVIGLLLFVKTGSLLEKAIRYRRLLTYPVKIA